MDNSNTQQGHRPDFLLFLRNMMMVGGVHRASDTDMEDACLELLEKYQPSNTMMFGQHGYILLTATAGTTIQVEALPVGGAPRLTTIVPRFQVTPLITAYLVIWQVTRICQSMPHKVKGLSLISCRCIKCNTFVPHNICQNFA